MNKITRILQASSFAIIAAAMLSGPGVMQVQAKEGSDKPVLAGPKAEKENDGQGKKFNGERQRGADPLHKLLGELKLTEAQKESVKEIMVSARAARGEWQKTNGEAMKTLGKEMHTAREAKDETKAKEIMGKMQQLRESMPKPQENLAKIRELLTPEQQTIMDAKVLEMKENRMGAKGKEKGMSSEGEGRKTERKAKGAKGQKGDTEKSKTQDGELEL